MTTVLLPEVRIRAHLRCNDLIRESADPAVPPPGDGTLAEDVLPFICECERPNCCATVWLSAGEYDAARAHGLPVLAALHWAAPAPVAEPAGTEGQT